MDPCVATTKAEFCEAIVRLMDNDPTLTDLRIKFKFANLHTDALVGALTVNTHLHSLSIENNGFATSLKEQVVRIFIKSLTLNHLNIARDCPFFIYRRILPPMQNELKEEFNRFNAEHRNNLRAFYAFCLANKKGIEADRCVHIKNTNKRARVSRTYYVPEDLLRNIFEYAVYFKPKTLRFVSL